jgi:hypothetical protein
LSNVTEQKK